MAAQTQRRRQHLALETTLARGLSAARRDPAVLEAVAIALLKNRNALDWSILREEAGRLDVKRELRTIVELIADESGQAELEVHVAELDDGRRKASSLLVDDSVRRALRKSLARSGRMSLAAARAAAAERERLRRMPVADRALLALDLGERLGVFRGPRG